MNINEIVTPSGEGDGVDRKAIPTTTPMYHDEGIDNFCGVSLFASVIERKMKLWLMSALRTGALQLH